jgi:hypothetical protein
MKVAVMASLFTKRDVDIDAGHFAKVNNANGKLYKNQGANAAGVKPFNKMCK